MTSIPLFFDSRKGQGTSENCVTSFNPPISVRHRNSRFRGTETLSAVLNFLLQIETNKNIIYAT